jgi:hypothetical protein
MIHRVVERTLNAIDQSCAEGVALLEAACDLDERLGEKAVEQMKSAVGRFMQFEGTLPLTPKPMTVKEATLFAEYLLANPDALQVEIVKADLEARAHPCLNEAHSSRITSLT